VFDRFRANGPDLPEDIMAAVTRNDTAVLFLDPQAEIVKNSRTLGPLGDLA